MGNFSFYKCGKCGREKKDLLIHAYIKALI